MANSDERRVEYILREIKTGKYLGRALIWASDPKNFRPYSVGDLVPISDEQLFGNNSRRSRNCIVRKVDSDSCFKYDIAYLEVSLQETKVDGTISVGAFKRRPENKKLDEEDSNNGIDWSGSEGWLKFPRW